MYAPAATSGLRELRERRPDVSMETIEKYLHNLYRKQPEFVYSVSKDFARSCQTPMLVLPDETPAHPHQSSVEVASLCPNAEITVFPWKDPPELKARTINRVRTFSGRTSGAVGRFSRESPSLPSITTSATNDHRWSHYAGSIRQGRA